MAIGRYSKVRDSTKIRDGSTPNTTHFGERVPNTIQCSESPNTIIYSMWY